MAILVLCGSSYPTSIITRIETVIVERLLSIACEPSYPTSIITRIETLIGYFFKFSLKYFLPHFHYNKDWNCKIGEWEISPLPFLPHFHYNKDWNSIRVPRHYVQMITSYPTSIITRIETQRRQWPWCKERHFLPHFHYNKDWNQGLQLRKAYPPQLLTPLPL